MADPVTLTAISVGASIGGGLLGAYGAKQEGESSASMYRYQAGIAKMNQQIAKQNADYALATGSVEQQAAGMKTRFVVGQTKATQAAHGLDVNTGSPAAVRESEQELGVHDQDTIRSNAVKRAYGFEVEAAQHTAQGQVYEMSADQSIKAGNIKAMSSILGAAGSVSSKWLQAKQQGIYSSGDGGAGNPAFDSSFGLG